MKKKIIKSLTLLLLVLTFLVSGTSDVWSVVNRREVNCYAADEKPSTLIDDPNRPKED